MVEGEGGEVSMGDAQSRRSARLARRQEASRNERMEVEESDPDFRVDSQATGEDDSDDEYVEGEYVLASDNDESEEEDSFGVHSWYLHLSGITGARRAGGGNLTKRLQQYGAVPTNPPHMANELSQELDRSTAAESCKHPCSPIAGRKTAKSPANASVSNIALMLWQRQANLSNSSRSWSKAQCCHISGMHYLPNRPLALRVRMESRVYIGQYSRHGNLFVGAFQADKRVRIYDTENSWRIVKDIHARNLHWTITDTCLSKDQSFLLYATINPVVHMVNVNAGGVESEANVTEIHEALHLDDFEGRAEGQRGHFGIFSIKWSSDGREIVAGTGDANILIYDMEKQKSVTRIAGHKDDVNAVAFLDESSNIMISGSDDHMVKVWDRRALGRGRKAAGLLVGHTQGITHIDPKGDGRFLLSNSKDQTAKVWDVRKMMGAAQYAKLPDPELPEFGWDYRSRVYPGRGYNIRHPHDCSVQTLRGHFVATTLIRAYWSPLYTTGQRYVYSASADGATYIYDTVTSKLVNRLSYHRPGSPNQDILRDVSWHPFQPSIVTAGFDGALVEWGYNEEPMSVHLNKLPDTGYDRLEDGW